MNDDLTAQLPQAVTKAQVLNLSQEDIAYLTESINHINRVMLGSGVAVVIITDMALKEVTDKDLKPRVRKILVEHYRQAGWTVEVDDTDRGTDLLFR